MNRIDNNVIKTPFASYIYDVYEECVVININGGSDIFDYDEVKKILDYFSSIKYIVINNIDSQMLANDFFKKSGLFNIGALINLNQIHDFDENEQFSYKYLTYNHELSLDFDSQSDIATWAHRLSASDKNKFRSLLSHESAYSFYLEEVIILKLYKKILYKYPNILRCSEKIKFELIFDYINSMYPYSFSAIIPGTKRTWYYCEWSHTASGTFLHNSGVCDGRSKLVKLVASSNYFNIQCKLVFGLSPRGYKHCWNMVVIDGDTLYYDLSYDIKGISYEQLINDGYVIEREEYPVKKSSKQIRL